MFGDDLVAGAVVAQRLTKWNMHIQRQRQSQCRGTRTPLLQSLYVILSGKSLNESICSRVGRVTWSRHVILPDQALGNGLGNAFNHFRSLEIYLNMPSKRPDFLDVHQQI
jgi:hypothetical protein